MFCKVINFNYSAMLCRNFCLGDIMRYNWFRHQLLSKYHLSSKTTNFSNVPVEKIRNIGIMAHIDAGKTTTTERMLYYSGFTRHIGDVDDGDTVTDYMPEERERGITITSAAVTFQWKGHRINLIDTPGHVDFTLEVERSLRVLDGAVAVLDASAGVEAQTLTVWRQADRYRVPRIAYLNKLDKPGADFWQSIDSMRTKLNAVPLPIQLSVKTGHDFIGVLDLIGMKRIVWDATKIRDEDDGARYSTEAIEHGSVAFEEALKARTKLVEFLADHDDHIADHVLHDRDVLDLSETDLRAALRKVTLSRQGVPVLCGSSYKNRAVQPLMDAVAHYLPSPAEVEHDFLHYYRDCTCSMAFKIVHDKQRGALTFLRIYSGGLKMGDTVYNVNRDVVEKVGRLLQISADEHEEIAEARDGAIVAVSGFKQTITGDTLVSSQSAARQALKVYNSERIIKPGAENISSTDNADYTPSSLPPVLAALTVPEPVYFCSVEPQSVSQQKSLEHALDCLTREDPSLRVRFDQDSGQTILSGMGELHLEIIRGRLRREYGVEAYVGPLLISYREAIAGGEKEGRVEETGILDKMLGDSRQLVTLSLSVRPVPTPDSGEGARLEVAKNRFSVVPGKDSELDPRLIKGEQLHAIENGVDSALQRGPLLGFPVIDVIVELHDYKHKSGTSLSMITACAAQTIQKCLQKATPILLQPMMKIEITTSEDHLHSVLGDLAQRRGKIQLVESGGYGGTGRLVLAQAPLSELGGYSTALRTITSGTATFSMQLECYEQMSDSEQHRALHKLTGYGYRSDGSSENRKR